MGCTKVSQGCVNCYAETLMGDRWGKVNWGPTGQRLKTSVPYWKKPVQWNKEQWVECPSCGWRGNGNVTKSMAGFSFCPACNHREVVFRPTRRRVFCASLADVFEDNRQLTEWREDLFKLIEATPNLDWLLLTKRPENILNMMVRNAPALPNVWIGASVESPQYFEERVRHLAEVPAAVRFLSVEPMIGPVRIPPLYADSISWVIVGGESGPNCRPMEIDWVRDIHGDCKAAGIPFFMKQDSVQRPGMQGRIPHDLWKCKEFPNA